MNAYNTKQIEDKLRYLINNNHKLQENNKQPLSINLVGEAGIGKTSLVRQIAESLKMSFVEINLSQLDEVGDLVGYPIKEMEAQMFKLTQEGDKVKRIPSGKVWITEAMMKNLNPKQYMLTNNTRMSYAKPAWVPEYNENGTIVLLDDYTRCTPVFMQAIMNLLLNQKYMSWKLPEKTTIVLTSNPDNGKYNVVGQDLAQQDRCVSYNVGFNADIWAQWAEKNNIDSRCISFALYFEKELFEQDEQGNSISTPRSFTMFCDAISGIDDWENSESLDMIQFLASGCLRDADNKFGSMFTTFITQRMHLMMEPKKILLAKWDTIADKLKGQVFKDGQHDVSVSSILERRFTNYVISWLDNEEKTPISIVKDRILDFIHNNIFTESMMYHMLQTLTKTHKQQTSKLLFVPEISQILN